LDVRVIGINITMFNSVCLCYQEFHCYGWSWKFLSRIWKNIIALPCEWKCFTSYSGSVSYISSAWFFRFVPTCNGYSQQWQCILKLIDAESRATRFTNFREWCGINFYKASWLLWYWNKHLNVPSNNFSQVTSV